MNVILTIEYAPQRQQITRRVFQGGELSIGRGDDADWQIEDPDKFVSRKHCVISVENNAARITDASRGGLFIDGSDAPLGTGNSVVLEDQMRLRMGDVVLRVEMAAAVQPEKTTPQTTGSGFDFSFTAPSAPVEKPTERPANLPDPFGVAPNSPRHSAETAAPNAPMPLDVDDPFGLDLKPQVALTTPPTPPPIAEDQNLFADPAANLFDQPLHPSPTPDAVKPPTAPESSPDLISGIEAQGDAQLRAAFFRGLGLDPDQHVTGDAVAEMEELGARFRAMVDGLMQMMRNRMQEKQNARVAQTIIGSTDVNPLKFLATTDEGVAALVKDRGQGYLAPDAAIVGTYRDLADHQIRTWQALQASLRRMIDHFDPDEISAKMEEAGRLQALLAGGRSAKLWQLYEERYREIASAAEERFLGEIGADFRDAYEKNGKD